jgi:hypothetical protein
MDEPIRSAGHPGHTRPDTDEKGFFRERVEERLGETSYLADSLCRGDPGPRPRLSHLIEDMSTEADGGHRDRVDRELDG